MEVKISWEEGDKAIIDVVGKINALTAPEFEKSLLNFISEGKNRIILNLSEVDYISSAGLRSILVIAKNLMSKGGKLILSSLQPDVKEVFEISGFTTIIPITSNVEEAKQKI